VPVSFGYHPYLCLPDVARPEWHVEIPVQRRLIVDDRLIPTGATESVRIEPGRLGDRTFDTPFTDIDPRAPFVLASPDRRIEVSFLEGYPYAQVYAPADGAFVCFEPMTAPTNALVAGGPALQLVAPGQQYTAAFAITLR
jgi:galactose mutarotase-like enzyme